MVCPNCKSSDIVTIQGQNYCINCGQLIPQEAVKAPPPPPKTPEPAAAQPVIVNHSKPEPAPPAPVAAPVLPPVPSAAPPSRPKNGRRVSDLSPAKRSPAPAPAKPEPEPEEEPFLVPSKPPKVKRVARKAAKKAKKEARVAQKSATPSHDSVGGSLASGFRAIFDRRFWSFGLTAAILAALPASAISFFLINQVVQMWARLVADERVAGFFSALGGADLNLPLELGQDLSLLTALVLVYLALAQCILVYAGNAVIYGASKLADRRSVATPSWANVGLSSLWSVVFIDVITAALLLVLLSANALVYQYGLLAVLTPEQVAVVKIGLAVVTAVLGTGTIVARKLARSAVVLGNLTPISAYAMGWKLFWRRFWLILGAGIISLGFSAVLAALYLASVGALVINFRPALHTTSGLAATGIFALVGILFVAIAVIFNLVFWTGIYRNVVRRTYPSVAALLVARQPGPPAAAGMWALAALTVVVMGLGFLVSLQP